MGRHESEYFVRRDTEKQIQELKKRPPDPDKPVFEVDQGQALAAGGRRALELGIAGAGVGTGVNPGVGTAVGALVGGTVGFVSGVIGDRRAQERAFQTVLDEYKIGKEQEKMADAAKKEADRERKRKAGGMQIKLPPMDQTDADIMAMSRVQGEGDTYFDMNMNRLYGRNA